MEGNRKTIYIVTQTKLKLLFELNITWLWVCWGQTCPSRVAGARRPGRWWARWSRWWSVWRAGCSAGTGGPWWPSWTWRQWRGLLHRCQCHGWDIWDSHWVLRCKRNGNWQFNCSNSSFWSKVTFNFLLISHLWSASTVKEMIDWIPKIIVMYFVIQNRLIRNKTWPVNVFLTVQCLRGV